MDHEACMRRALALAERGRGLCSPNPVVGALVVKGGHVVGEGWHEGPGTPHAEAAALAAAGDQARGGILYVTLEPCDHQGRTPPCTRAILEEGVATVVAATVDPNPVVDGRGFARLRAAGRVVAVDPRRSGPRAGAPSARRVRWDRGGGGTRPRRRSRAHRPRSRLP